MALDCRFCGKAFSKGEHLRRHERSHTGHRPFACKHCKRAFTRQDSLMRHQKVHGQQDNSTETPLPTPPTGTEDSRTTIESLTSNVAHSVSDNGALQGNIQVGTDPALGLLHNTWQNNGTTFDQGPDLSDIDLNLIWPDSEDLFQSILSADLSNSWQLPPGTLPLPSTSIPQANAPPRTPSSNLGERLPTIRDVPSGDNHRAVHGVSQMVSNFSSSITAAVESTSITSVFLDECLHMFFDKFIPTFPIMHRATFVYRDCSNPLLLNAIAIGSLYLGPNDAVAKGEVLWRLAHTAVATSWQGLIAHRGPYDACPGVQLVLSALLSVIYGALSKNTTIRGASQALHASAFWWARQCGIFDCELYDLSHLPPMSASQQQKVHQWKLWVAREIQQRALLSHYVLDGLIAHMQGNSTSVRHTSNTLKLPSSEPAFQDTSVDDWLTRMHSIQREQISFRDIYRQLFVRSDDLWVLTKGCSTFSLRVLLEGLQSMIADSDPDDGAIINPPTRLQISHALSWLYEKIAGCADISEVERLEILLRWHAVCLEAVTKTPPLCNYICKRWNAHQALWPNNNLRDQEFDLPELVDSPGGREAMLHSAAIQDIVERLPRGRAHVVHMPSSLFAAATIYGVYCFAGQAKIRLPSSVEWKDVVLTACDPRAGHTETAQYIKSNYLPNTPNSGTSRNLLYELNSIQKLFGCLATQWGVSSDMEKVISQWVALCH